MAVSQEGRFTYENDLAEAAAAASGGETAAEPVSVADQRAQGVAPGDTVTMADQRAGAAPAEVPEPEPQPEASKPKAKAPAPLGSAG